MVGIHSSSFLELRITLDFCCRYVKVNDYSLRDRWMDAVIVTKLMVDSFTVDTLEGNDPLGQEINTLALQHRIDPTTSELQVIAVSFSIVLEALHTHLRTLSSSDFTLRVRIYVRAFIKDPEFREKVLLRVPHEKAEAVRALLRD